jgi:hypothetical protein
MPKTKKDLKKDREKSKGKGKVQSKGKSSPAKQKPEAEEVEEDDDQEGSCDLEEFKVPGQRTAEITAEQLKSWPKTMNCKFYVAADNKNVAYELANGESDKVCNVTLTHTLCVCLCIIYTISITYLTINMNVMFTLQI